MKTDKFAAYKVLVVDDDELMLELIAVQLGRMGIMDVELVNNGRDALKAVKYGAVEPDILMCDLQMPDMDGVEVLRHLAGCSYSGGIVLFSGEDSRILKTAESLARAHELNVMGTLEKPVDPQALLEVFSHIKPGAQAGTERRKNPITRDELCLAIEQDHLVPFYQPKVDLVSGKVVAVEALVRWLHPGRGMIPPVEFIPLAEESDLIDALTYSVFDQATRQGGIWRRQGLDLQIGINISMKNLDRIDLPEFLMNITMENGMDLQHVMLEVTESSLMRHMTLALDILTRLRLKGIGLSIDDFGTGYSSMEQLKQIPFSELKIDYAFVHGAQEDATARAILESSVELANKLNMTIVAEGVETQADWDLVSELGCHLVQGYWIAKPMPAEAFDSWTQGRKLACWF